MILRSLLSRSAHLPVSRSLYLPVFRCPDVPISRSSNPCCILIPAIPMPRCAPIPAYPSPYIPLHPRLAWVKPRGAKTAASQPVIVSERRSLPGAERSKSRSLPPPVPSSLGFPLRDRGPRASLVLACWGGWASFAVNGFLLFPTRNRFILEFCFSLGPAYLRALRAANQLRISSSCFYLGTQESGSTRTCPSCR